MSKFFTTLTFFQLALVPLALTTGMSTASAISPDINPNAVDHVEGNCAYMKSGMVFCTKNSPYHIIPAPTGADGGAGTPAGR